MLKRIVIGALIAGGVVTATPDPNRNVTTLAFMAEKGGHRLALSGQWDAAERGFGSDQVESGLPKRTSRMSRSRPVASASGP